MLIYFFKVTEEDGWLCHWFRHTLSRSKTCPRGIQRWVRSSWTIMPTSLHSCFKSSSSTSIQFFAHSSDPPVQSHPLILHFFSLSPFFPHITSEAILCDVGEFHCLDKETCVPEAWLCDGESDCPDDSDESDTLCKSFILSIANECKAVIWNSETAPHLSQRITFTV